MKSTNPVRSLARQVRFGESHRDLDGATSNGMDSKTIKHIASLARIELTSREEEKISNELSAILGYIDKLNNINTDQVEPLYQITGLINSMREDKSRKDFEMDEGLNEKLIGQAPKKEKRFIKVKSVLRK